MADNNQTEGSSVTPKFPGAFELLTPSWKAVRKNIITLIEFVIVPIMFLLVGAIVFRHQTGASSTSYPLGFNVSASTTKATPSGTVFGLYGLSGLVFLLFAPGLTYTLLCGAKNKSVAFGKAFTTGLHYFWRYLGVMICSSLLIIGGFILFIVPGFFMLRRYFLAPYYLLDRDLGVFETLRVSARESKQFSSAVWGVIGVQFLFSFFGIIPFVGWIASLVLGVMYYAAPALRYLQITERSQTKHTPVEQ